MKRTIRLTESDLHKVIKNIISEAIGDDAGPVFPNNLKGTSAKFVENSDDVFICGDYHGRYEDDDCEFLVYNIPTRKFRVLGWTTRAYCSGESPFDTKVIDVNKVDGALQQEITEAAKEEAKANPEEIMRSLVSVLKNRYPKSYSQKTLNQAIEAIQNTLTATIDSVAELPVAISLIYNSPYSGYDMDGYFSKFCGMALQNCGVEIKSSLNRKPQRVKLQGDDYTGQVVSVRIIDTRFGRACKVGILPDGGSKSVWAIISLKQIPEKGEVITLNGTIGNETEKSITLYSAKRIDKIDPSLIDRLSESVFHRIISETVKQVINEVVVNGQSLHGNDPNSWNTLQQMRKQQYQASNNQNQKAGNAWMRNFDNKKELQAQQQQQQQQQNPYQSQLVSRRMNNGKYMIFDPNQNAPITDMQFDQADPYMIQGHRSISAVKDNTNYEVYPNGQVQRVGRF